MKHLSLYCGTLEKHPKPRNLVAKDLRSPKYRMRVAVSKKRYDRNVDKNIVRREIAYE